MATAHVEAFLSSAPETDAFTPEFTNLVELLNTAIKARADRRLFGIPENGQVRWVTYAEFGKLVDRFRSGLSKLGVRAGDRVAVISNNRLEWAVAAHATYGLAATYVPMYEAQHDEQWRYILADSSAKICLVADHAIEARINKLLPGLPDLQHVICFEGDEGAPSSYANILRQGEARVVPATAPDDSAIATIIYTSGTTGNPKGVRLSHFNLASNVSALLTLIDISDDDQSVAFLPWAHVFGGCVELNCALATGCRAVICSDPTKLQDVITLAKPTALFAVPRVWHRVYDSVRKTMASKPAPIQWLFETALQARAKTRRGEALEVREKLALRVAEKVVFPKVMDAMGGRLRFACSGAAALSREVAEFMENLGIEVYEGYGMTETTGCTTASSRGNSRLGAVGKPIPGVRIRIDRSVTGASDEEGEIVVYGMGIMSGYHNREEDTREILTEDGGLRTGDLGRLDSDGYLHITGRVKELYKLENGKYVAPGPLEGKIQLSPYIAQCMVYGSDKPYNVALIVPDMPAIRDWAKSSGIQGDDEALIQHPQVRTLLEAEVETQSKGIKGYERVKSFLIILEPFSLENDMLTPTLKLKRRNVIKRYGESLASLYGLDESERDVPKSSYIRELRPHAKSSRQAQAG